MRVTIYVGTIVVRLGTRSTQEVVALHLERLTARNVNIQGPAAVSRYKSRSIDVPTTTRERHDTGATIYWLKWRGNRNMLHGDRMLDVICTLMGKSMCFESGFAFKAILVSRKV